MAKFFDTSIEIVEMAENEFSNIGLDTYGLTLKCISTSKSKDIISVTKASATTEFVSKQDSMIIAIIYEKAFDRLNDEAKKLFVEAAFSGVSYDSEKDKILVDKNQANMLHRMRHKYNNSVLDTLELNEIVIKQIEEEEKAEKEAKKLEKEAKRAAKKNKF